MNLPTPFSRDDVPLAQEKLVDEVWDAFEAASKAGGAPRIEAYLVQVAPEVCGFLLRELVLIELHYQTAGPHASQEYLSRFPDLDPAWLAAALQPSSDFQTPHADQSEPKADTPPPAPENRAPSSRRVPWKGVASATISCFRRWAEEEWE